MNNLRRRIMVSNADGVPTDVVDLGLPSGLLWAQGNLCKDGSGNYYIGSPESRGAWFQWADPVGHNYGEGYYFDPSNYTTGRDVVQDIQSNDAQHDAALANLGSPYRMPTKSDFEELFNTSNVDREWTSVNGTNGYKFMKKSDHSVFIFLPLTGIGYQKVIDHSDWGVYWTSNYNNGSGNTKRCYRADFSSSQLRTSESYNSGYGLCIRPVVG